MNKLIYILAILILINIVSAANYLPNRMSFQGYLRDESNNPVTGTYSLDFVIYNLPVGGTNLWDVYDQSLTVTRGIFNYDFKNLNLTGNENYYLGIYIDDVSMGRLNITQAMWTQRAQQANNLTEANNYKVTNISASGYFIGQATNLTENNNYKFSNLTLTQKITFALGEMIDNIVNGWIQITGNANITGTLNATELESKGNARIGGSLNLKGNLSIPSGNIQVGGTDPTFNAVGDAFFQGKVKINNSLLVKAIPFGPAIMATNDVSLTKFTSTGGATTYNEQINEICDATAPFTAANVGDWIGIISSSPADFAGAFAEILGFSNTSCITIANYLNVNDQNFTTGTYYVIDHPSFAVMDGGAVGIKIGSTTDDRFHIYAPDARTSSTALFEQNTNTTDNRVIYIRNNIDNKTGSININSFMYMDDSSENVEIVNMVLGFKSDYINNSHYDALVLDQIGNKRSAMEIEGIHFTGTWDTYITQGSEEVLRSGFRKNATDIENVTAAFTSTTSDVTIFRTEGEEIYIGNLVNFTEISVSLATLSAKEIDPAFFYCKSDGTYGTLTATDGTNGMMTSGLIKFINPSDRAACNQAVNGSVIPGVNQTYIAIRRTRASSISTPPVERLITIGGAVNHFILQETMLKLQSSTAPPRLCVAGMKGALYFDDDLSLPCWCTGANWVQGDDYTTVCS